jgi:lysophospholipase L1-like esterase
MNLYSIMLTMLLLPVLIVQGIMVKLKTPLLPEASGAPFGLVEGPGDPFHLIVMGESTVAGIGVDTYDQAIAAQTASALGRKIARPVSWRSFGRNGMMVYDLRKKHLDKVASFKADSILISVGVNDVLHMHGPKRYARDLHDLITELRRLFGDIPIVLNGIAPMGYFPAIPQPLRYVLGLRARVLDHAAAQLCRSLRNVRHCSTPHAADLIRISFASDGFHPNATGYSLLGNHLGTCMTDCAGTTKA